MVTEKSRELSVTRAAAGLRLDRFLATELAVSREQARRLLEDGRVQLNDRPVGAAHKGEALAVGEVVTVRGFRPPGEARAVAQPERPLRVLAAGAGWVAVDKPAGMAVHPLREDERDTALNAVAALYPAIHGIGEGGLRSGVAHRLDVETSGVLLFATEQAAWERLRALFARHKMAKTYRAIVLGELTRSGSIELALRVARSARPARVEVVGEGPASGTRACGLSWRPVASLRGATLVEARPVTGFLHQVRVTFAHLGHPLAGDRVYGPGPGEDPTGAARHMLHAARLAWDEVVVESPDPADFVALLARLAPEAGEN
jgi:23S rRNA pseudouridine1911/1915/1917 synthase